MARPLVGVTLAFAAGILLAEHTVPAPAVALVAAAALYAAWILATLAAPGRRSAATLGLLAFLGLGTLAAVLDPARREAEAAARWADRRVSVEGLIAGPVEPAGEGRARLRLRVTALDGTSADVPFTLLATVPHTLGLRYGDVVAARGVIELPDLPGNPGEPDLRGALRRQGIAGFLRFGGRDRPVVVARGRGPTVTRLAFSLRERLAAPLLALPPPYGGVLAGLLLGLQAGGRDLEEVFRRAGLLHIMVVSGAQVALVAGATLALTAALRMPRPLQALAAAGVVLFFSTVVGWSAAVGRAALMGLVSLGALALSRDADPPSTLALAALLWLAAHPPALFTLGFQLSFAATWGLLFLRPLLTPPARPRWLAELIAASTGAQLAVLPLLATVFQRVSLAAFPANLAVLPLVAVIVPAGFAVSLVGLVLPSAAAFLASAFYVPIRAVVGLARLFAAAPGAQVWVPPMEWWHTALAYAGLLLLPRLRGRGVRWTVIVTGAALAIVALSVLQRAGAVLQGPTLTAVFLDVGQGDAIVIVGPTGRAMLVDAGGDVELGEGGMPPDGRRETETAAAGRTYDVGAERVVPALRRLGLRRLEVVVISHAHEDHVGGLPAVLQNFSVGLVLDPGVAHSSPSYTGLLGLVTTRRIPYALARAGQRLELGSGTIVDVVSPPDGPIPNEDLDPVNARSTVARVRFGRVGVLLTGDIEAPTDAHLVRSGMELTSAVLKVAHHGSRSSTTEEFLEAVRPQVAVISAGRGNLFRHPHAQTVRVLAARGIAVYRTDRDGAVTVRTDGHGVRVETMHPCARESGPSAPVCAGVGAR